MYAKDFPYPIILYEYFIELGHFISLRSDETGDSDRLDMGKNGYFI
jgi:hypothetical protein